jgi:hypothetical protein
MRPRTPVLVLIAASTLALAAAAAALVALALGKGSPAPAARAATALPDPDAPSPEQRAIHALRRRIAAEELAHALKLDAEQKAALADVVEEALRRKDELRAAREKDAPELRRLLSGYLAELQSSGQPSAATVDALRAFHEARDPRRDSMREARGELREEIREILDDAQIQALREFRPMAGVMPELPAGPGPEAGEEGPDAEDAPAGLDEPEAGRGQGRGSDPELRERMAERRHRGMVRHVLMSEEMLEILKR